MESKGHFIAWTVDDIQINSGNLMESNLIKLPQILRALKMNMKILSLSYILIPIKNMI
jgi:hypothetical protein